MTAGNIQVDKAVVLVGQLEKLADEWLEVGPSVVIKETRRLELAEAAEKRQKETTYRGVKNPQAVERNKKNKEMEKQEMRPSPPGGGGGGMKWQVG